MPELTDVVRGLLGDYAKLKGTRRKFEADTSVTNRDAREGIIGEDGNPAYSASPGLADEILSDRQRTTWDNLGQFIGDGGAYTSFSDAFYRDMSDEGKAKAYGALVEDHDDIRAGLPVEALKRVAAKHKLDDKLSESDPNFRNKPENEKVAAYEKAVKADKEMKKEFVTDASYQVAASLGLARQIDALVGQGKINEATALIDDGLGVSLGALYRNEGQMHNAQLVASRVAVKQREYAEKLMRDNGYVAGDVEKVIGNVPLGYARAAGEVYSAYNSGDERGFRSGYDKAKAAKQVTSLSEFRNKRKEAAKQLFKEAA